MIFYFVSFVKNEQVESFVTKLYYYIAEKRSKTVNFWKVNMVFFSMFNLGLSLRQEEKWLIYILREEKVE